MHAGRIDRLHPNHLNLWPQPFDIGRHPANHATAANRHEHRIQRPLMLAQDFHGDGTLPRNHLGVVIGVDEGQIVLFRSPHRLRIGLIKIGAVQHHLGMATGDSLHLNAGGGDGHNDGGGGAQLLRRQSHPLRMVARAGRDYPTLQLGGGQTRHFVISTAQLKGKNRLQILTLQQHAVTQAGGQLRGILQRGFNRHVIDTGG